MINSGVWMATSAMPSISSIVAAAGRAKQADAASERQR
jgi:hypothetical protein